MDELEQLRRDRELKLLRNEAKFGKYAWGFQIILFIAGLIAAGNAQAYSTLDCGQLLLSALLCMPLLIKLATKRRP